MKQVARTLSRPPVRRSQSTSRRTRTDRSKPGVSWREIEQLAATPIEPWTKELAVQPTRDQWIAWNKSYGAALRAASGVMTLTKDELAKAAAGLREGDAFEEMMKWQSDAIAFFKGMAELIEAAQARLIIGGAVCGLREADG
ncbi:hypothetical protein [Terrarubrum flagellatum]|uniref:hypothetical protein n=1 Tax=Terrirubrum flagellatum TaxID=2895980 RepID=UPI00314510E8